MSDCLPVLRDFHAHSSLAKLFDAGLGASDNYTENGL